MSEAISGNECDADPDVALLIRATVNPDPLALPQRDALARGITQSPSTILATMSRWISDEPPKIV
jgi:hypothetical protein